MRSRMYSELSPVRCEDIASERVHATCGDCGQYVTAIHDDYYGWWVECDCDSGYTNGESIMVIVMDVA